MNNRKATIKKCTKNLFSLFKSFIPGLCGVLLLLVFLAGLTIIWHEEASAGAKLKSKMPDVCYSCHKELKEGLKDNYVHFLFKQGKCITCHNSHVSSVKGLMINEVDALCLGCHEKLKRLIDSGTVHSALRDNDCTECHFAHSGENKDLLVVKEKDLCMKCHEGLLEKMSQPVTCAPFSEGKCSACHNSHASEEMNLLSEEPVKLCNECHAPKCRAGTVSIASVVADKDCTTCHSGHSSLEKGLLGPYGHKAFLEKKCEECHGPITAKTITKTKLPGAALCVSCHDKKEAKYQYFEDDIHLKTAQNPCIICHDYHASDNKNMTMSELRLCISCHENTEKRTEAMEKVLKSDVCEPIKERKCFECHIPAHSDRPLNYRSDEISLCSRCHASEHKTSHPQGENVLDPRTGEMVTCNSCHSMHSSKDEFMLTHDRKRALCIQCHIMK